MHNDLTTALGKQFNITSPYVVVGSAAGSQRYRLTGAAGAPSSGNRQLGLIVYLETFGISTSLTVIDADRSLRSWVIPNHLYCIAGCRPHDSSATFNLPLISITIVSSIQSEEI